VGPNLKPISISDQLEKRFDSAWSVLGSSKPERGSFSRPEKDRIVDEIRAKLSMYGVYEHFGGSLYRGWVPQAAHCVIHEDQRRSAKVMEDQYVCYAGCGRGDIFWVLRKMWGNIPYGTFLRKINDDFGLGLEKDKDVVRRVLTGGPSVYKRPVRKPGPVRDRIKVHTTYQAVLDYLPLLKRHREHMISGRSLPADYVDVLEKKGYRSYKSSWEPQFIKDLTDRLGAEVFYGVPGFYQPETGGWRFYSSEGMIFPVLDINGTIQALMVRRDTDGDKKYCYVSSSDMPGGTKAAYGLHVVRMGTSFKNIWVVEGILKSDVVSLYLKDSGVGMIVGVPSLSSGIKEIAKVLNDFPKSKVYFALDSDWRDKPAVRNGVMEMVGGILKELNGQKAYFVNWEPGDGKGLDDVLVGGNANSLKVSLL